MKTHRSCLTKSWNCYCPIVVKNSLQYQEREEEGELLREATDADVVNVARCYHHETVYVGNREDDIRTNVRNRLDVTKAENFKGEKLASFRGDVHFTRNCQSSTAIRRKRSSSQTNAPMPPTKW
jgi:hypothetical protein